MEEYGYYCKLCLCMNENKEEMKRHIQIPRKNLQLSLGSAFKYNSSGSNLAIGYVDNNISWNKFHFQKANLRFIIIKDNLPEWWDRVERSFGLNWNNIDNVAKAYDFLFNKNFVELSDNEWEYVQRRVKTKDFESSEFQLVRGKIPKVENLYKIINPSPQNQSDI